MKTHEEAVVQGNEMRQRVEKDVADLEAHFMGRICGGKMGTKQ